MIRNYFHTKLPFYETNNFSNQPMLQANKAEAALAHVVSTITPLNFYPEFVFLRSFSTASISSLVVWNVTDNALQLTVPNLVVTNPMFFRNYLVPVPGATAKLASMFTGGVEFTNQFECGKKYQYRMTMSDGKLYYSEWFEAAKITFPFVYPKHFSLFAYFATCNFAGIAYPKIERFANWLWLKSEAIRPETEIETQEEQDNVGVSVSTSHKLSKKYLLAIPEISTPSIDAANTLPMYAMGEQSQLMMHSFEHDSLFIEVLDVELEKPDYSINEIAPILRMRVQIDPSIIDGGCCDTDAIICYAGLTPKPPTVSSDSGDLIVQMNTTNNPEWYNITGPGAIPDTCQVIVYISLSAEAIGGPQPITYTAQQLEEGISISGLSPGAPYYVRVLVKPYGDYSSDGCYSNVGEPSEGVSL